MSLAVSENIPWSGRRWFLTIALLAIIQFALILALTESPTPRPPGPKHATSIRMIFRPAYEKSLKEIGSRDPTLFALVHPQGFSGAAWLHSADFPYRLTSPMHPPQPLAVVSAKLGEQFVRFIHTNLSAVPFALSKLEPARSRVFDQEPPPVLRPHVKLDGSQPGRLLLNASNLPPADPSLILTNCLVSVMVAPNGDALSATLLASSGSPATDAAVLAFTRTVRFTPHPATNAPRFGGVTFERLVFQWLPEAAQVQTAAAEN